MEGIPATYGAESLEDRRGCEEAARLRQAFPAPGQVNPLWSNIETNYRAARNNTVTDKCF